jgi:rubrerythrin
MAFKNNGDYFDHRNVYGKGHHDGYKKGLKAGQSDDGFGLGALIGGVAAGVGGLIIGALSSDGGSSHGSYVCDKCGYRHSGNTIPERCPGCYKKTKKHWDYIG